MVESLLNVLETRFTPERITLHIELTPGDVVAFELPIEEAGKKLSMVANYAASIFGVRVAPLPPSPNGATPPNMDAYIRDEVGRGSARAVKVLEGELARARSSGDPAAIAKAEAVLAGVKEKMARAQQPAKPSEGHAPVAA